MRGVFASVGFWLGVALGTLSIVGAITRGFDTSLHGLPSVVHSWYVLVFHGLIDLCLSWTGWRLSPWAKDLITLYFIAGFIVLRSTMIVGALTWIDDLAGTSARESVFQRFTSRIPFVGQLRWKPLHNALGGIFFVLVWPLAVPLVHRSWTLDGENARQNSEQYFGQFQRSPSSAHEYQANLNVLENAADQDSIMYLAYMERNAFVLSLHMSANFTFLAVVLFFVASALSLSPPK